METEVDINNVELDDISDVSQDSPALFDKSIDLIKNVKVNLIVSIGKSEISVDELFSLKNGSTITLDRDTTMPVDISLDGKTIAQGDLVAVGDNFGVCITKIMHY